jgi:hypothetical protein
MGKTPPLRDPTDPEYEGQKQVKMFGLTLQEKKIKNEMPFSVYVLHNKQICVFPYVVNHIKI